MKFSPRWRHVALAALAYATGVNATTITVTSVADSIATGVGCTLRAAIEAALEALPKTGEWKWNKENEND